jgi:mitogen-activated protein kinase kinase kinase 5
LDFEEISVIDTFYNADVAIVDVSIQDQQNSLFYRLGNRESFGMKQNILLFNDSAADVVIPLKLPTSNYTIVTYRLSDDKRCYVTEPSVSRLVTNSDDSSLQNQLSSETKMQLCCRLKKLLLEVEIQTK